MIIRHLPYFAVAAEEENLQRAASRLGITQPALSRRIHDLESELGLLLFDRVSGRLKLTPMGQYLGSEARRIVDDVEQLTRRLREHSGQGLARLSVGLNERAIAIEGVGLAIRTFRTDNPAINLSVKIMSSTQQLDALKIGEIDLSMLYLGQADEMIESYPIIEDDPFVAVYPFDHRLAELASISLRDLDGEDLIWPSRDQIPLTYDHLASMWRSHGLEPRVKTEVYSGDAAIHAVSAGLGVAVIRQSTVNLGISGVQVKTITDMVRNPFPISVAWRARQSSPVQRRFLRLLAQRNLIVF